jgi:hypothetical protein
MYIYRYIPDEETTKALLESISNMKLGLVKNWDYTIGTFTRQTSSFYDSRNNNDDIANHYDATNNSDDNDSLYLVDEKKNRQNKKNKKNGTILHDKNDHNDSRNSNNQSSPLIPMAVNKNLLFAKVFLYITLCLY